MFNEIKFFGALGGIRTPDPLVRSQVLYPTELRARVYFMLSSRKNRGFRLTQPIDMRMCFMCFIWGILTSIIAQVT